jgi:hypothetical protein
MAWDYLIASANWYQTFDARFTLEPKSLKHCGCLTADTNTTLYAIDNAAYSANHNLCFWDIDAVRDKGLLWHYVDCVAKKGPTLTMEDGTIIGCDPATGRNQEVNFTWEQLCIATKYELEISKDMAFTMKIFDPAAFRPASVTSPALVYFAGGGSTFVETTMAPALECGHTYYWRVRVKEAATGECIISPWSEKRAFTIKAGFRVTTPYYGPQLLEPINGCGCPCDAPLNFSWSPFKETTKYKFELSENPDMSSPVVSTEVPTTAYQYTGSIKCNTSYFWRVMSTDPAPSEWSAVFTFKTQAEEPPPPPPPPPPEPEKTPIWVWVVIAIGAVLVIVTLVLIFKTRRV